MKLTLYQVDAFASEAFRGNPAAVIITQSWLPDDLMQKIAMENNLSETAFVVPEMNAYGIRWFTPLSEVALCGHATLASAFVLFRFFEQDKTELVFQSRSRGELSVNRQGSQLILDFPADQLALVQIPEPLAAAFSIRPDECWKGITDYLLVYKSQEDILQLTPDFEKIKTSGARGVMVTAPGTETDFVSRFFAPAVGVNEDPVTGSAHTSLIPYWANRLKKTELTARQLSKRVGELNCRLDNDRVHIGGQAVLYLQGEIELP